MSDPTVSICLICYNQASYIEQAIQSILKQIINFNIEIIVGDDCSNDGTRQILERYQSQHPDKVFLRHRDQNLGIGKNVIETLNSCTGKYIAILEGDDYWSDPHKLQKQVDQLERHSAASFSFHRVAYLTNGRLTRQVHPPRGKTDFSLQKLFEDNFVQTCSLMFRRSCIPQFPDWMKHHSILDWPICILLREQGDCLFDEQTMAVYRQHQQGSWSSASSRQRYQRLLPVINDLRLSLREENFPLLRTMSAAVNSQRLVDVMRSNDLSETSQVFLDHYKLVKSLPNSNSNHLSVEQQLSELVPELLAGNASYLTELNNSLSWKLTLPLRILGKYIPFPRITR